MFGADAVNTSYPFARFISSICLVLPGIIAHWRHWCCRGKLPSNRNRYLRVLLVLYRKKRERQRIWIYLRKSQRMCVIYQRKNRNREIKWNEIVRNLFDSQLIRLTQQTKLKIGSDFSKFLKFFFRVANYIRFWIVREFYVTNYSPKKLLHTLNHT